MFAPTPNSTNLIGRNSGSNFGLELISMCLGPILEQNKLGASNEQYIQYIKASNLLMLIVQTILVKYTAGGILKCEIISNKQSDPLFLELNHILNLYYAQIKDFIFRVIEVVYVGTVDLPQFTENYYSHNQIQNKILNALQHEMPPKIKLIIKNTIARVLYIYI